MSRLVTDHLPLLAGAPNGVKKLRELILQLAVTGRLNKFSGHAWRKFRLGDIGTWGSGGTPAKTHSEYYGGEIPWLVIGDLNDGLVTQAGTTITAKGLVNSSAKLIPPGTILIAMYGSIGKMGVAGIHCATNQAIAHCQPDESKVCGEYLFVLLQSIRKQLVNQGQGLAQQNISQKILKATEIALPTIIEQSSIVAKVNELMSLCDRLEIRQSDAQAAHARLVGELLGSLLQARDAEDFAECWGRVKGSFDVLFTTEDSIDAAKQAILRLAFAGRLLDRTFGADPKRPDSLPEGWREVQISDIAQVGTGATPARTNPAYFEPPEFYWVTSGETSSELINTATQRVSALALAETNLTLYPPGTLIVAMYGQGKTRGQVSELAIEACTNQACAAIQLKEPSPAHRRYVKYFFEKSYDDLRDLAAGGAQPNLNLGKIKTTLIPLPPLADQHRIVAKLDELLDLCDRLKARIRQARQVQERLAGTLVERAML